jgi:CRP/FNR family transcriptional regulator, cyclic AMP receptor protein
LALIDDGPRTATAVAIIDVTMVAISRKQFPFSVSETLFSRSTSLRTVARHVRVANERFKWV